MGTYNDYELWLAFATILLVAVTGYYAIQTRRTVQQMKKSTEAEFLPHLRMSVGFGEGPLIELFVTNVGKAAAVGVQATFRIEELEDSIRSWTSPLLVSGESVRFPIPVGKDKYEYTVRFFEQQQSTLLFQASYSDIFGEPYTVSDSFDITSYVKQLIGAPVLLPRTELGMIKEALERIEYELRALTQTRNQ